MEPDDLLCSRNAHDQNVLVRRAQWEINQPPSLKRKRASLEGLSVASLDGRSEPSMDVVPRGKTSKLGMTMVFRYTASCTYDGV
jgi:hypothetical protein